MIEQINVLFSRYRRSLEFYKDIIKTFPLQSRVMVLFVNYFKERKQDLDNLDQKIFIDACVSRVLISDDNYANLSHIMIRKKK